MKFDEVKQGDSINISSKNKYGLFEAGFSCPDINGKVFYIDGFRMGLELKDGNHVNFYRLDFESRDSIGTSMTINKL